MAIKWRSKIILLKMEGAYATDPTPATGNGVLMTGVTFRPMEGTDVSRDLEQPFMGAQELIPVGVHCILTGRIELVPSGTAGVAPAWGPVMRVLGCSQTIVTDTSVTYVPISDNHESAYLYFWIGLTQHKVAGIRGNGVLRWNAQGIPYLEVTLMGLYAGVAEEARVLPTLTGFKRPRVVTLCLDARDGVSAPGSGQKWLDISGNGYDFFRGPDGTATAADPTHAGTPGVMTAAEKWTFDGGDYFVYDSANEAWMNAVHQNNALFGLLAWIKPGGSGQHFICGTMAGSNNNIGFQSFISTANGNVNLQVANGSGTSALATPAALGATSGAWQLIGTSFDEAAGTGFHFRNGTSSSPLSTAITSPSAAAATNTLHVCASGNAGAPLANGSELGGFLFFAGVAPTATFFNNFFAATRGVYGI